MNFALNPNFFLPGTNLSLKIQARMEDKVRIKNFKSLLAFFEKFGRATPAVPLLTLIKQRTNDAWINIHSILLYYPPKKLEIQSRPPRPRGQIISIVV